MYAQSEEKKLLRSCCWWLVAVDGSHRPTHAALSVGLAHNRPRHDHEELGHHSPRTYVENRDWISTSSKVRLVDCTFTRRDTEMWRKLNHTFCIIFFNCPLKRRFSENSYVQIEQYAPTRLDFRDPIDSAVALVDGVRDFFHYHVPISHIPLSFPFRTGHTECEHENHNL